MKKSARISAALLLLLVWCLPDLIHAAGPGLPHKGQVCAFPDDFKIQEKEKQPPKKPEQPPEEKKKDDAGQKSVQPGAKDKQKGPRVKPAQQTPEKKKIPRERTESINRRKVPPASREKTVKPEQPSAAPMAGASPLDIFSDIETGWKVENVDGILQHFGNAKVSISVGGIGLAEGRFSKSQSYYLLKDLFKYTLTKKFDFVQFRNVDNGQRRAYAVAERYYKRTDDGRLFKDKIYVSLTLEDGRWVINEIKSIQ